MNTIKNFGLLAALIFLPGAILSAQVVANFSDGNTTEAVDGFVGQAGDGWTSSWVLSQQLNTTTNGGVLEDGDPGFSPLTGTSNYLAVDITSASATLQRSGSYYRNYGANGQFDPTALHTVSFLYRADDLSNVAYVSLFDGIGADAIAQNATTSWLASGQVRTSVFQWVFPDGPNSLSTGAVLAAAEFGVNSDVRMIEDAVYSFSILVDPTNSRYQATVTNLDYIESVTPGVATFTSDWLGFVNDDAIHGRLNLAMRLATGDGNTGGFSVDNIHIIPEPALLSLFAASASLVLVAIARRRRR